MDVVCLDPPYNQHPYGSNYFMLNLLSSYEKPAETVMPCFRHSRGIGNAHVQQPWQHAPAALFRLLEDCLAKFILLSYSSEGFISYEEMTNLPWPSGTYRHAGTPYATFRGSRNLRNRPQNVIQDIPLGCRDRALLEMIYACGSARVSEVISCKLESLDMNDAFVRVLGKERKRGWCLWVGPP